jgi:hypothetical protein
MNSLCSYSIGQRLWFGRTPSAGSRALGRDYKSEDDLRDVHAVEFKTKVGRKQGFYVKVCEPDDATYYLISFDVRAPRGSFKREYSKIVDEAKWLLCANVDRSTYICRSRASAEMLVEAVTGLFEGYIKNIMLCPVRPDSDHDRVRIDDLLEDVRRQLVEEVEEAARRCTKWTLGARRRFKAKLDRLKSIDESIAESLESMLRDCLEYINHCGSAWGSSMVRLPGNRLDSEGSHGELT